MTHNFLKRAGFPDLAIEMLPAQAGDKPCAGLLFLPGFRSDMQGTKARFVQDRARDRGQACTLFDYSGHGKSGGFFEDGSIGAWTRDALDVIDRCTQGPLLLIGSSMGGWIALLCAMARKDRIAGIIGLAAAPDFTRDIQRQMNPLQKDELQQKGFFTLPNDYADQPYSITRHLLEEGERHCLLDSPIPIDCPVRLIQGKKDADVPWITAQKIYDRLTTTDKEILYRAEGDHRLSTPDDLACLDRTIVQLTAGG